MGVNYFLSTDPSAPVLDGTVGSLVNLLDKCLVNGYGSKSPLGWGIAYTATNVRVYRAPSGNRMYLKVDDSVSVVSAGGGAAVNVYETMSGISTGTNPFWPANDRLILKSVDATSSARPWALVGDERLFYLSIEYQPSRCKGHCFGEIISRQPADPFATVLMAMSSGASGAATASTTFHIYFLPLLGSTQGNSVIARRFNNLPGATAIGFASLGVNMSMGTLGYPYPNRSGNLLVISPSVEVVELGNIRGTMPGFRYPLHLMPLTNYSIVTGVAGMGGRSLLALSQAEAATNTGQILLDITGPWR